MGSNITVRIKFSHREASDDFFETFDTCLTQCGFSWSEVAVDLAKSASTIEGGGHMPFVIFLHEDSCVAQGFFNFAGKGTLGQIFLQPGQLWAGAQSYMSRDYKFLTALHQLAGRCFEALEAEEATAYLDDIDEPWFRFSKASDPIPLPELVIDSEAEE